MKVTGYLYKGSRAKTSVSLCYDFFFWPGTSSLSMVKYNCITGYFQLSKISSVEVIIEMDHYHISQIPS